MAPRTSRRRMVSANYNASKTEEHQYHDDSDDAASATTGTPTTTSNSDSDQDSRSPTPPCTPPRTSLKSLLTKAKVFVPTGTVEPESPLFDHGALVEAASAADAALQAANAALEMAGVADMFPPPLPPCVPTPGKDCLANALQKTLGNELWNLNMMDCAGYGEWFTAIEVVIPALSASTCHLVTSQDTDAIEAAQQAHQAQVVQSVTKALQELGPNMVVQSGDPRAQICAEFCAADKDRLCQEFSHFGSCPRGGTCRWGHAMVELFMINFILAPLEFCAQPRRVAPSNKRQANPSAGAPKQRWVPQRPPMRPTDESLISSPSERAPLPNSPKALEQDLRPKNPRLVSAKKWADIEEESDDDWVPMSFDT